MIICPECKEKTFIKVEDYKIELYNCKNGHQIKDILLDKYEELQNIDISKIICQECKENKKSNTFNNEFENVIIEKLIYVFYVNQHIIKNII